jgi:hypothetical protein
MVMGHVWFDVDNTSGSDEYMNSYTYYTHPYCLLLKARATETHFGLVLVPAFDTPRTFIRIGVFCLVGETQIGWFRDAEITTVVIH